jgi:hypothetical protein
VLSCQWCSPTRCFAGTPAAGTADTFVPTSSLSTSQQRSTWGNYYYYFADIFLQTNLAIQYYYSDLLMMMIFPKKIGLPCIPSRLTIKYSALIISVLVSIPPHHAQKRAFIKTPIYRQIEVLELLPSQPRSLRRKPNFPASSESEVVE